MSRLYNNYDNQFKSMILEAEAELEDANFS